MEREGRIHKRLKQKSFGNEGGGLKSREKEISGARSISSQGNEEGRSEQRFGGQGDAISHIFSVCLTYH